MGKSISVKKGDTVIVLAGKDKGKKGKVLRVVPKSGKVVVEGINVVKKHQRPTRQAPQGGVVESPAPIDRSNIMVICDRCNKPTKVGVNVLESGDRVRVCKQCGSEL